ncbi:MAG: class I SAM-dependent methyltransferase [Gammaproteobacteria bacterium]|nr:class I SAM-dependent methyltransferase [Gammaproteobacteria bacterium]NNJ91567.1 class I SAM-dependent methyltransferase [Gammaproteobacteria bacterium]
MNDQILNSQLEAAGFRLANAGAVLSLEALDNSFKSFYIDFIEGKNRHRRLFGGGKGQPLARAVGMKKGFIPSVLDVTAGMGRDAFVLATLGCTVTMIERSPVISMLLENALQRAAVHSEVSKIVSRISFYQADSLDFLEIMDQGDKPDVIYMDPMYPHRDKSAQVKKEMRIFRALVGDDIDSDRLLELARSRVLRRIVVKRPKGAEYLAGLKPHSEVASKNTRYDIYLPV